jgi:glutaredoxin 3
MMMNKGAFLLLLFVSSLLFECFVKVVDGVVLSTGVDVNDFIEMYIHDHDVMVFAKSYCPHCKTSKSIMEIVQQETNTKWNERFLYLDYMTEDGPIIQNALYEKTGQRTVPNVFVGGKHIGGNSDLVSMYQSGELLKTIEDIVSSKTKV